MSSTYARIPISKFGDGAELKPDRFLLARNCESLLAESTARDVTGETVTSQSNISAVELAILINDPVEAINASFPRISALLADAQVSIIEERIDDLYCELQQVSELLQGLITHSIPITESRGTVAITVTLCGAETLHADVPAEAPTAYIEEQPEPLRAMAMAA